MAAVYLQTAGFPWIHLDDYKHIFENPLLLNPSAGNLLTFWKEPFFTLYIPFTYTVWFTVSLATLSPWAFHLTNVAFHVGSTILVFWILMEIFEQNVPALAGALLFGLHPVQVEAVTWISGLKDCLSGFLVLVTVYLYTLSLLDRRKVPPWVLYVLVTLALLSKPAAVMLPFLLIAFRRFLLKEGWGNSFRAVAPFFLLVIPIAVVTKLVQPNFQVKDLAPLWFRPMVAVHAIGYYLKQLIIPNSYHLDYGRHPSWLLKNGWEDLYLLIPVGGLAYLTARFKKHRTVLMAVALFLIPLVPVLGIVPFQFQLFSTIADRYLYLSMFGVAFAFCFAMTQMKKRTSVVQCLILVFFFSLFTFHQVYQWRSNESIMRYTILSNPNSFLARNNLAYELFQNHQYKEAAEHLKVVVQLRPEEPELFVNYSSALAKAGQTTEALSVIREVLKKNPNLLQAQKLLTALQPNL